MKDIKQTDNGDLDLSDGDLQYIDSARQHQKDLLLSRQGWWKEHPATGVDVYAHLNDTDPEALLRATRKEFAADGMKVRKVQLHANGEIETDATYENR